MSELKPDSIGSLNTIPKSSGLFAKAFWIVRNRPQLFFSLFRRIVLFQITHVLSKLIYGPKAGIFLGRGVRIQSLRSLMAERPSAKIYIGDHSIVYEKARLEAYGDAKIVLGASCILGDTQIFSRSQIELGDFCITSWNVFFQDFDPHPINSEQRRIQVKNMVGAFVPRFAQYPFPQLPEEYSLNAVPIRVGNNVWIGANVIILKGAQIGNNCVVAAGAVVGSGQYPDNSLIAGVPARVVKTIL